ncbi:hypothetical protein MKX08_002546 [Trichoderma sp. CBMAI-0020]|nr:hypothetical protein MKX08_002546 [Trichoderma sp. CBMAI-0020]
MSKYNFAARFICEDKANPYESIKAILCSYGPEFPELDALRPVYHYALMSNFVGLAAACRSLNIEHFRQQNKKTDAQVRIQSGTHERLWKPCIRVIVSSSVFVGSSRSLCRLANEASTARDR